VKTSNGSLKTSRKVHQKLQEKVIENFKKRSLKTSNGFFRIKKHGDHHAVSPFN